MTVLTHDQDLASPGTWKGAATETKRSAMVTCPGCGREMSLTGHYIFYDGKVTPSLVCPFDCGFHDWITLENWKP